MRLVLLLLVVYGQQAQSLKYMMLKKIFITLCLLFIPLVSFAQTTGTITPVTSPLLNRLQTVGTGAGYAAANDTTLTEVVGMGINAMLGLLGTIFIVLMILAGYSWMSANGDDEKISKAKDTIKAAIIGLVIVAGAFAIWNFISAYLIDGSSN